MGFASEWQKAGKGFRQNRNDSEVGEKSLKTLQHFQPLKESGGGFAEKLVKNQKAPTVKWTLLQRWKSSNCL
jgi:hypothetical protein